MSRKAMEGKDPSWGKGQFANMPQGSLRELYPKLSARPDGELDDTMSGIDQIIQRGYNVRSKFKSDLK